jgi:hypothetical protein
VSLVSFQSKGSSQVDGMPEQCPLCERLKEPSSEFCGLHSTASRNLENALSSWSKAYHGKISKEEFLDRIETLPETGQSVRQVIRHLREKGAAK